MSPYERSRRAESWGIITSMLPAHPLPPRPAFRRTRRLRLFVRLAAAAAALALLVAINSCGSGSETLGVVDPLAAPLEPTYEQVREILDRRCVGCHGGSGEVVTVPGEEERDDPHYGDCAGIVSGIPGILDTSVDGGSMPPGALPRMTEREKMIIRRWAANGACAPCNPCP
ncbi:MAG TPA: hypothetical protein VLT84_11375 [Acidobacteriota bacterium]|nr:hypothetical protein [Acidobacteriota bacterium]